MNYIARIDVKMKQTYVHMSSEYLTGELGFPGSVTMLDHRSIMVCTVGNTLEYADIGPKNDPTLIHQWYAVVDNMLAT